MTVSGSTSGTTTDQVPCFCCGALLEGSEIIRFELHPQQGVCADCAAWLHKQAQPPARKAGPGVWRRHGRRRWRRE